MTISVIIPAFNAQDSIGRCLESVLAGKVEVIVIDDGSTDSTADIVRSLQSDYPALKLISQENKGVSAARNAGLDVCTGDYVLCVDADDYVANGAFALLESEVESNHPDVLVMRSFASGVERYPWTGILKEGRTYDAEALMRAGYLRGSVCGCAFSKEFICSSGLRFQEELSHSEDVIFMSMALSLGAKLVFKDLYFYEVCASPETVDAVFFKRYGDALLYAEKHITNDAVRVETSLRLILGMTHSAIRNGISPKDTFLACSMDKVLPLKGHPLNPRSRIRASLLNTSYPLFYYSKVLSERFQPSEIYGKGQGTRVLLVTYHYLSGAGGGVFASRGFINALCEIYGSLTLICPVKDGQQPKDIDPRVRVIPVVKDRPRIKKILDVVTGHLHFFRPVMKKLLDQEHFDVVVFDNCNASARLFGIAERAKIKTVTIHHNWQYAYEKDNSVWPLRPFTLFYVRRFERDAVRKSDLNITLTVQDRDSLYNAYDPDRKSRIEVCPPFEYR